MNYTKASPVLSKENFRNEVRDNADAYSTSPYASSLPSPPYSEENYNGSDERDWSDRMPYRVDLTREFLSGVTGTGRSLKNESGTGRSLKNESGTGRSLKNESGCSKSSPLKKLNFNNKNLYNKNIPAHLAKVYPNLMKEAYPNLMKGVLGDTDQKKIKRQKKNLGSPPKKKQKIGITGSPQKKKQNITCQVCSKDVPTTDIKHHLYFGHVKCLGCGWTEEFCPNFSSFHLTSKIGGGCQHSSLKWNSSPVEFLRKPLECDTETMSSVVFRKKLNQYLQPLLPLKNIRPWSKAFDLCNSFINSPTTPEPKSTYNDTTAEEETVTPKKRGRKPLNPIETIDLPDGEFYLILKEAIEECPNCYEKLNPSNVMFNIETWLINVICGGCSLKVYFVLPPPDGSEPKIKILHES